MEHHLSNILQPVKCKQRSRYGATTVYSNNRNYYMVVYARGLSVKWIKNVAGIAVAAKVFYSWTFNLSMSWS